MPLLSNSGLLPAPQRDFPTVWSPEGLESPFLWLGSSSPPACLPIITALPAPQHPKACPRPRYSTSGDRAFAVHPQLVKVRGGAETQLPETQLRPELGARAWGELTAGEKRDLPWLEDPGASAVQDWRRRMLAWAAG